MKTREIIQILNARDTLSGDDILNSEMTREDMSDLLAELSRKTKAQNEIIENLQSAFPLRELLVQKATEAVRNSHLNTQFYKSIIRNAKTEVQNLGGIIAKEGEPAIEIAEQFLTIYNILTLDNYPQK